ncbi:zinc ABC transporter solute-binding protein [Halorubellus sp. JP-L1]|uniref:metal ABC transporter substrate-binding protein n=1 Tax=Halorubellus sp. JP-L1 TaxID=2715753 RepID=UPI001409E5BC|nr:metal ABC transporter substrate-binding protein [Halorubellus sp. JP-L1]NHN43357.1 zinc ABC transporter solute-binding protein [Halorubellus sp. JP-L1]
MGFTRRRLLSATVGAVGTSAFAGCLGDTGLAGGQESAGSVARSTFFVFDSVAAQVAGDAATADLLVPIGQHGHGWEPGPRVREDVHTADLLVHGMDGFQPWADDIRADLDADDSRVVAVDASAGLDLLEAGGNHDDEAHHDEEDDHEEDDHEETHEEGGHEGGDGHDHGGGMDPHFWMDALRARDAVGNVRRGLVDVDPENAEAYAENADAFRDRLEDLHERVASTVAAASNETVLVAGHDSFQYFSDRYGVTVEALTNVSPDDRPTTRDIERAQEVIDAHDLRYICADPLESQRAADQLVDETDVEAVLPLTAMPGLTDEWANEEWGYVEIMERVNLPTLEQALDA